ncbi:LysR family transcriptional regulator [Verticiella sediminum]|uniref:LysR family transcriptional regulator n=1 Tax=Verticiella sediminum TaxID=1247510 RepID=UPI001FE2DB66|nr:LysR family transcriptional regulator [Verticiella sediminum]
MTEPSKPQDDPDRDASLRAPDFSLRQLSYFVAAAHHQSVQKAAAALHVSAPAISAAIAHLETTLGEPLFLRRHARGLILTELGSAFAIECRSLLQEAWGLGAGRLFERAEVHGRVRLGCLFTFGPYVVPPLLKTIQAQFPRARVEWREGHHEHLLEALHSGAIDLAVMYDFEVPSGIIAVPLRPAPLQVVLAERHPLAERRSLAPVDLLTEPLVLLDLPRTRDYMLSAYSAHGATPRVSQHVYSMGMLLAMVASGHGISLLNFCPPYEVPGVGRVVSRAFDSLVRQPNIVVAYSHRYHLPRVANAVIEQLAVLVDELVLEAR